MWTSRSRWTSRIPPPCCRVLLGCCREYGYVHVPKKKPPHVLGPSHLWRKCFVVNHLTEVSDPLAKHQWLTKSTLVSGLPECITSASDPSDAVIDDFEERACDFLAHQVRKPYNGRGLYSPHTISGLYQSMLTSVWAMGDEYLHLRSSHMTLNPNVEGYWRRNGESYISQTEPLYIMHTDMALGLFCGPDYVGEGLSPVQYSPLHLGLFKRSFDQILPFGGSRRFSPFGVAHTVFMVDQKSFESDSFHTHGLVQLFSQSAGETVQNRFRLDRDLQYPLATQGIVTNGKRFTFVCFQLNTLDLCKDSEEGGKCNVFWAGPSLNLFESIVPGEKLEGFNRDCARLIFKFLLHRPVRRIPRQMGGQFGAMPRYKMASKAMELAQINDNHSSSDVK